MLWRRPPAEVLLILFLFAVFFYMLRGILSVMAKPSQTIVIDLRELQDPILGLALRKGRVRAKKTKRISKGLA